MAGTYSSNIAALPGLASGANDDPAGAIQANTPLNDGDVVAANRQHDKRKFLLKYNQATADEVVAAKKRKVKVTNENADAIGPAWAQGITNQMNQLQNQINQRIDQLYQTIPRMLLIDRCQATNRAIGGGDASAELVMPPRLTDGQSPLDVPNLWCPRTTGELDSATAVNATALLDFYGLESTGNVAAKRTRLRRHFCGP